MADWQADKELFALIAERLSTAIIGDICDDLGLPDRYLDPGFRPLQAELKAPVAGRAMPVIEADVSSSNAHLPPFGRMFEALDSLRPGEIYICAGSREPYALFGELMSVKAAERGAVGAVCDGYVRDSRMLRERGFPVFCRGSYGRDQRNRGVVVDYNIPIQVGHIEVSPGDVIVADQDGVVVVPQSAQQEVFTSAFRKADAEDEVRTALRGGAGATDVFAKYGIF